MLDMRKVLLFLAVIAVCAAVPPAEDCSPGVSSLRPHETECAKFYQCNINVWMEMTCGEGTVYNPTSQVCDWPHNVECQSPSDATDACSTAPCENGGSCATSGNTYVCTCLPNYMGNNCETPTTAADGPGGACSTSDPYQANPNDCSKFYGCVNNLLMEFTCPPVTPSFNDATGSCDFVYNVECGKPSSCTNDTRLPGNSLECDEFYRCVQQEWVQYKCQPGYRFSDDIKDCSDSVDCPTATTTDLPCDSNPCLNNGVCSNFGGSFSCQCPAGYGGETCEISPQCSYPCPPTAVFMFPDLADETKAVICNQGSLSSFDCPSGTWSVQLGTCA